ncbi:hypothetical protein JYG33_03145 [Alcaligenes sp. SORT26]|uniref:hypothetical protein n=1 Tax=Alcaligenes sp. SORT26 TaxID=2813780 RepID=UPI001A9E348F|nr:hypothetical protein [Alcaligenes sp. SORT26]QTC00478.1 hypothetical protein JYG33_03145 [Alcaligenes sp. SORT26]
MERAFFTKNPTPAELRVLANYLGTYRDGTGGYREKDGSSRADSRQIERCFAEFLHGSATESKMFYDFLIEFNESGGVAVRGASIKSKEVKELRSYKKLDLRAHLEISNSSASDWRLCRENNLTENDFLEMRYPEKFGEIILARQVKERILSEGKYKEKNSTKNNLFFVDKESIFISVLYSPMLRGERDWLVSTFNINLPKPEKWQFEGKRLVGLDETGGRIYEWYALSGSQFKYYPKISSRAYGTDLFTLPKPTVERLQAKSARLFGA